METIWGHTQTIEELAPGIQFVTTASHGGVVLSDERKEQIPWAIKPFTGDRRYWEEDIDWAVPYLVFERELREHGADAHYLPTALKNARDMLAGYKPEWLEAIEEAVSCP